MSSTSKNVLKITDKSGTVTAMTYVDSSAQVTAGQKYSTPPTIQKSGRVFTITFSADRKKSSAVANAFNSASGGTAYEYAASGGGGTPDELNFFFTLQLSVSTAQGAATVPFNVAQGHFSSTNNWWLGGAIVTSHVPSLDVPITASGATLMLPLSGSHDSFTFGIGTIK